jgi:hypothetical protein
MNRKLSYDKTAMILLVGLFCYNWIGGLIAFIILGIFDHLETLEAREIEEDKKDKVNISVSKDFFSKIKNL